MLYVLYNIKNQKVNIKIANQNAKSFSSFKGQNA